MAHLLVLLSVVAAASVRQRKHCVDQPKRPPVKSPIKACAPTQAPTTTTTTTTLAPGRRRRDADQVEVTIVSRQNFDPEMNPAYLKVVEAKVSKGCTDLCYFELQTAIGQWFRSKNTPSALDRRTTARSRATCATSTGSSPSSTTSQVPTAIRWVLFDHRNAKMH